MQYDPQRATDIQFDWKLVLHWEELGNGGGNIAFF
jgi:hypothetical protein